MECRRQTRKKGSRKKGMADWFSRKMEVGMALEKEGLRSGFV